MSKTKTERTKERIEKKEKQERIQKVRDKRWNKIQNTIGMMSLLRDAREILGVR